MQPGRGDVRDRAAAGRQQERFGDGLLTVDGVRAGRDADEIARPAGIAGGERPASIRVLLELGRLQDVEYVGVAPGPRGLACPNHCR